MRTARLIRKETGDEGTFGTFITDSGFTCRTGELPWRDNASGRSCIPAGTYVCTWRDSPKHGPCYHVENVPGRSDIEIHSANFMGDPQKDYLSQLLGCIAPGLELGSLDGQTALLKSREALGQLEDDLERQTFQLTIVDQMG